MVGEAWSQLLFCAATGGDTPEGPYAYLVDAVYNQMCAYHKHDSFWIPPLGYEPIPVPTDDELYELCLAYALVRVGASMAGLHLGDLYSLISHLRRAYVDHAPPPATGRPHSAQTVGQTVESRLLGFMDGLLSVRGQGYTSALTIAARERSCGLRWSHQIPRQRSR